MSNTPAWWPWLRRLLLAAFLLAVAVLLVRQARDVDWAAVREAVRGYPGWMLAGCAALAATSYAIYCSFDVLGRHYVGHDLPARRVIAVAFVSYAFNLNMGALVGGAGFRFRLYSQRGLDPGQISRVLAFSVVANWSGYLVLLGAVLALRQVPIPAGWELGATAMQWLGVAMLLVAAGYLLLCGFSRRRSLEVRGHELVLPPFRLAAAQVVLSALNWSVMATIVFLLLGQAVTWPTVLGVLLLAAVAGAMAHVPAGLGVLEAVFVLILAGTVAKPEVLAALLTYRAIYYLAPLALAVLVYAVLEVRGRRASRAAAPAATHAAATGR